MAKYVAPRPTDEALVADLPEGPENLLLRLYTLAEVPRDNDNKLKSRAFKAMQDQSALVLDKALLGQLAARQEEAIQACAQAWPLGSQEMRLASAFTCGLSQPTTLENGMTLLRPYGIPFVPGTSWKGACRSWLAEILADDLNISEKCAADVLRKSGVAGLLGEPGRDDGDDAGGAARIRCFDALPTYASVRVAVTTPHHQRWYSSLEPPAGFENPIPVPFLVVAPASAFVFRFAVDSTASIPLGLANETEKLRRWGISELGKVDGFLRDLVKSTGLYRGFGSRSSRGHGRMLP